MPQAAAAPADATGLFTKALPTGGSTPAPDWVHLLPAGTFGSVDERKPWAMPDVAAVIAASQAGGQRWVIDYEHQTDNAQENGQPAPAAGWIKQLAARADGLWGLVEWTEKAAAMIAAKEYRFLSPVFDYRKSDRRVIRILRAGLTNNPALTLTALANRQGSQTPEEAMTLAELLAKLSQTLKMPEAATSEALCTAIAALMTKSTEQDDIIKAMTASLAPQEGETLSRALARRLEPAGDMVPRAAFDRLSGEVAALKNSTIDAAANDKVAKAMASGIIPPAQKDWAMALAKNNPESFDAFMASAAPVFAPGAQIPGGANPPKSAPGGLTKEQLAICAATGVSAEDFIKTFTADQVRKQEA